MIFFHSVYNTSDMFGFRINQEGSNNLLQFQSVYGDTNINTILTLNRDTKEAIFSGHVKLSTNSHVMSARKFTARDGNGVMLTADDASSGLTIADNGNATFSGTVSASNLSGTNTGDQDLSGYVATSGDQTITGVKTFDTIKINKDAKHIIRYINKNFIPSTKYKKIYFAKIPNPINKPRKK